MQKQPITGLIIAWVATILFASCTKTNTQGKLIPKNASMVVTMDSKSLSSKLPWDDIKQNPLFTEIKADSTVPAAIKGLLDNPESSGMDIKSDCIFFVVKDSSGGYIGFEGKVKDENVFKTFNKQVTETGIESEKDGVQFISKFPMCVGWTKEKFVYVVDVPQMARMDELSKRMRQDSISMNAVSGRDIGATCKAVFALKEDNSLAKNEHFTALMKEGGDVRFWINSEEIIKNGPGENPFAMINLEKFYKGSATAATMNFDNGKILVKAKTYASGEMLDLYKKYGGGKINEDMIKHMPGKDVIAVMALNYKPQALMDLIKMTGMDGLVNMGISKLGFTMEDFVKANKGDFFIGFSDLSLPQDENMSMASKPNFNFIVATSIGDKESFNKIVNAGKKLGGDMFNDSNKAPVSFNMNKDWFALSNNKQTVDQYLGNTTTNFDFISKINGEPFGGYLSIQSLLKSFGNVASKDSTGKIAYDASVQLWDNVLWKGGNYSDGGMTQTAEINLVDKSTNSLKQLSQYAAKLSELYREQRRKHKEEMMTFQDLDSTEDAEPSLPAKSK